MIQHGFLSYEDLSDPIIRHHFGGRHDFLVVPCTISDLGARIVAEALADHLDARAERLTPMFPTLARLAVHAAEQLRGMAFGEDEAAEEAYREGWRLYDLARGD